MRCLPLALGLLGLAGQALAADLPDFPPIPHDPNAYMPAFPTYFRWEGFYFGGQLALASAHGDFTSTTQPLLAQAFRVLTLEEEEHPSMWQVLGETDTGSAGVGGYLGYNVQWDNAVIGVEFNYTHLDLNLISPNFPIARLTPNLSNGAQYGVSLSGSGTMRIDDVATARARFGWVADNFMPYLTMGLAAGRADFSVSVTCGCIQEANANPPVPQVDFSFTTFVGKNQAFLFGYSGGGGLDVALTAHLFARLDYEYIQFMPVSHITSHINMGRAGIGLKF
jgi:outer membrane immunogenic protein